MSASYNAETKEIRYSRIGDMKASGVLIKLSDGTSIEVESMNNTGFAAVLSAMTNAYEMGMKAALK